MDFLKGYKTKIGFAATILAGLSMLAKGLIGDVPEDASNLAWMANGLELIQDGGYGFGIPLAILGILKKLLRAGVK